MTLSVVTAFSGITDKAPISPAYMNSKFSEVYDILTELNTGIPFGAVTSGSTTTFPTSQAFVMKSVDSGGAVFNVRAYGAVGDGVTDDTAPIQRALTRASTCSGTVLVPDGTYALVTKISIPQGVRVQGMGLGSILKAGTAGMGGSVGVPGPMSTASADVWVDGLYFKGSSTSSIGERAFDTAAARVRVTNCRFTDVVSGVRYSGTNSNDGYIAGNYFDQILGFPGASEGYGVQTDSLRQQIVNNSFRSIERHAIYISGAATGAAGHCVVANNIINGIGHSHAIQVYDPVVGASAKTIQNCIIAFNVISNVSAAAGIVVQDNVLDTILIGNRISDLSGPNSAGIIVRNEAASPDTTQRCLRTLVAHNHITNTFAGTDCILVLNTDDTVIDGNILIGNSTGRGIYAYTAGTGDPYTRRTRIVNNDIRDCLRPIRIDSGASDTWLGVNFFHNNVTNYSQDSGVKTRYESARTLAASAVTESAANTNLRTDDILFTIGGASGASLVINSGGTAYIFNSALSAKLT